jgi:hypothetical protein
VPSAASNTFTLMEDPASLGSLRVRNTLIDGNRFCSELAAYTNATVIAATDTQFYTMSPPPGLINRLFGLGPQDEIDFGQWEGKVMRFPPDGHVDTYQ